MRKALITTILAWTFLSLPALAQEQRVEARLPSGMVVTAAYSSGKPAQPAVIVLHGFLQTRDFPTVVNLAEALSEAGYSVLAPTLSLGISKRARSLPCEAVHTHTLDQDVAELAFWTQWLKNKGHQRIVLIGHSFGSLQILEYLVRRPDPAVGKALLLSLTDVETSQPAAVRAQTVRRLRERIARGDKSLVEAAFGYCRKYVSPAAALLSYAAISRGSILDALAKVTVPVEVIMGGKDDRMGSDWPDTLAARGVNVHVIPGANHFFDNQYEFDLSDAVLRALADRGAGR